MDLLSLIRISLITFLTTKESLAHTKLSFSHSIDEFTRFFLRNLWV